MEPSKHAAAYNSTDCKLMESVSGLKYHNKGKISLNKYLILSLSDVIFSSPLHVIIIFYIISIKLSWLFKMAYHGYCVASPWQPPGTPTPHDGRTVHDIYQKSPAFRQALTQLI